MSQTENTAPQGAVDAQGVAEVSAVADAAAVPSPAAVTEVSEVEEVTVRRAPKLTVFLVLGAMLGALVTLILTSLNEPDPNVGFAASYGYFLIYGIPAGLVLGAVVGLILDRRSLRRARTVTVEREHIA